MYTIDKRGFMSAIAFALLPPLKNESPTEDRVTYYFHIGLDIILGAMNSDVRNIDDAIDEQRGKYEGDTMLPFLFETLRLEIMDIKKQFMLAGFDRRLKYKLVTRNVGVQKIYGIQMDLESTVDAMNSIEPVEEKQDSAFEVNQEPTIDELNAAYNW